MDKENIVHTHRVKYYSALKRKKILSHSIMWMKCKDIMVSEKKASHKKANTVWFYLYKVSKVVKFTDIERKMVTGAEGRDKWRLV